MQNRVAPFQISDLEDLAKVFLLPFQLYLTVAHLLCSVAWQDIKPRVKQSWSLSLQANWLMLFLGREVKQSKKKSSCKCCANGTLMK